ncbi:MAG: Ribosomal large subunit pseudouridine synthase C [Spirochaetes bacterium ADurb.Bin269]|nr:MAG: Ribosomal large subunit pseudouridine synthase C [Spirochaetes bacterium ADurb.Bin269]
MAIFYGTPHSRINRLSVMWMSSPRGTDADAGTEDQDSRRCAPSYRGTELEISGIVGCMKRPEQFSVVYEDEHIVVLNKASGLLVAQDRWDPEAPRLDVLATAELCAEGQRLYAVHRIDKDTSGLVIYAKTEDAHRTLSMAFENREVEKTYHALVNGRPSWDTIEVDMPLRADGDAKHRTVKDKHKGKDALTIFRLLAICGPYCWLEAKPVTGRTHQIRVHLQISGLSIVCDPLYSTGEPLLLSKIKRKWHGDEFEERPLLDRLGLHAFKMKVAHPATGETMEFTAPYPKDLDTTRKQLAKLYRADPFGDESDKQGNH